MSSDLKNYRIFWERNELCKKDIREYHRFKPGEFAGFKNNYYYLDRFFEKIYRKDAGPIQEDNVLEPLKAEESIKALINIYGLNKDHNIIDIGCGDGRDLNLMEKHLGEGIHNDGKRIGLSFVNELKYGFENINCDQSFIPDTYNNYFDCVYARHVLEHSVIPYFTLTTYNRILKDGGVAYIELPVEGLSQEEVHYTWGEGYKNHYSIFGDAMWEELFNRAGFFVDRKYYVKTFEDDRLFEVAYSYYLRKIENWYE